MIPVTFEANESRFGVTFFRFRFTPTQLVERLKVAGWNLKAVIDLTFTSRYYSPKVCTLLIELV